MNINAKEFIVIDSLYCHICDTKYENRMSFLNHKKNSSHRKNKEIMELNERIMMLEKRNYDLEKMVNEGIDAIFMYEMKLYKLLNTTQK
jgi:cytoplasmic iron level regulating protein YaaA (DUF328/UPF0246 family)